MSQTEMKYSLSKSETKLFSSIILFGGQIKQEIFLSSGLQGDKAETALNSLVEKGLLQIDDETGVYTSALPFDSVLSILDECSTTIDTHKKHHTELYHQFRRSIEEDLEGFRTSLENSLGEFKNSGNQLQESLINELETKRQQKVDSTKEFVEEILSSFSNSGSNFQSEVQSVLSSEGVNFEKEWDKTVEGFRTIPEVGARTLREIISQYEKQLASLTKDVNEKISSIHTQIGNLTASIEANTIAQFQDFFSNTETIREEFKTNMNTGLQESRKSEKEFFEEIQQLVQVTLLKEITKTLKNVVSDLASEIDSGINEALIKVREQTDTAITESSKQIKLEFKEFAENASELIQEQRSPLDVLNTELSETSSGQKLETTYNTFLQTLQAHLTADLNALETNYRRVQKSITDIMENMRRDAKNKLVQQISEFEALINSFNEVVEKSIARKDMDVIRLQELALSINQLLNNLLVSVPMRSTHFKSTINDTINKTKTKINEALENSSKSAVIDIQDKVASSQTRIDTILQDTLEESHREIRNVIASSEQNSNTITNLHETYLETIESRFEQRAKVMNTELEAVARNFQQIYHGIESSFTDITDRVTSEGNIINVETSLLNSVTQLKKEVDTTFSQSQSDAREFINKIESNVQAHLDNALNVIKENFNQIKVDFNVELENQVENFNDVANTQQNELLTVIDSFSNSGSDQLSRFKTNLSNIIEENHKIVSSFITETRRSTDEVVTSYKTNISKYQEKGPTDILSFINQVETEVTTQNKNLKDALEELISYYGDLTDSLGSEVSSIIRQVQESGDRLETVYRDSLQDITNNLDRANEHIDMYFSDSMTEIENQIGVASGFVTSEVTSSTKLVQDETQVLKDDMEGKISQLNSEVKDLIIRQDQELKEKIPELTQEFKKILENLLTGRSNSNLELEKKMDENLEEFMTNWNNQIQSAKTKILDVINTVNKAINSNIENLEVIVNTNVEHTLKRLTVIYGLDASKKEDVFGLREIQTKVNQASKQLKSAISDNLKAHIEKFEQQIPELANSYDAVHKQIEEDLITYLEDFSDLISSTQASLIKQVHDYIKDERQQMDFSEEKDEINSIIRDFNQVTNQSIEDFSLHLTDNIQLALDDINQSRNEIQELFSSLPTNLAEKNSQLINDLKKMKSNRVQSVEDTALDSKKEIETLVDSYQNDLEKSSITLTRTLTQLLQEIVEEIEKQVSTGLSDTQQLVDQLLATNNQQKSVLEDLSSIFSLNKPLNTVRLVKLETDEAKNEFIFNMVSSASKQVTFFTPNPTFLSLDDLKTVPSEKRIWIFTSYDFTKKGKKWLTEVGKQVNINIRKSKSKKLSGLLVIQDESSALVLPDTIGFTTSDSKFVNYLSGLVNLLKGSPVSKRSK
jgi:hypothetical protein